MVDTSISRYNTSTGGVIMKHIWSKAFHITIILMGLLLVINVLFPTFLHHGVYCCMLILFLIGTLLLKLSTLSEKMKERARGGI